MSSGTYITSADITPVVASGFALSGYLDRTNDHVEYVGYSIGVTPTGIVRPVHFLLKEYARAWCLRELYRDKIGANNTDIPESDKYLLLYNIQNDEVEKIRKNLTPEILMNVATTPNSTACGSVEIYRA